MNNLSFLLEKPIAHRGLHNKFIKENSIDAFKRAITFNYPIELDVRLTKDFKTIICHDPIIKNKKVKNHNFNYLKSIDKSLVTLKEVLNIVNARVGLLIELKAISNYKLLCQIVKDELNSYPKNYAIHSFDPKIIKWWKKHSNIPIGIISSMKYNGFLKVYKNSFKKSITFLKPDFISFKIKDLPNNYIKKLKDKKMIILGWTARDQKQFSYGKLFCNNIIFDNFLPNEKE